LVLLGAGLGIFVALPMAAARRGICVFPPFEAARKILLAAIILLLFATLLDKVPP
jgi:hypothetical protein